MVNSKDPDYMAKHNRLYSRRGKAKDQICVIGEDHPAEEWSQVHDTDGWDFENHYRPMCRAHHKAYDDPVREPRRAQAISESWTPERRRVQSERVASRRTNEGRFA